MAEKLKPCPFCGTVPHTESNNAVAGGRIVVADCPRECPMHRAYVQVLAWNGRALSDAEELLRQAMNALGTVDKNEPGQPIADNGMTVWDGMRLESKRLWKLYREHCADRDATATAIRSLSQPEGSAGASVGPDTPNA